MQDSTFITGDIHDRLQMRTIKTLCAPLRTGHIDEFWQFLQRLDIRGWEVPLRAMVILIATKTTPEMVGALMASIDWQLEDLEDLEDLETVEDGEFYWEVRFRERQQRYSQWKHAKEKARLDYATPQASTPSKGGKRL